MLYAIAYILAIALARICYWFGTVVIGFPVAGVLAKASDQIRGVVAGILCGLGGVAASVEFSHLMFHHIIDDKAFGVGAVLAATVPLVIPIRKDLATSRLLFEDVSKIRNLFTEQGAAVQDMGFAATAVGLRFRIIGATVGILAAFVLWLW